MAGRKAHLYERKHDNNRDSYEAPTTDITSDDPMYTTESYGNNTYKTNNKWKTNDGYTSGDTIGRKQYESYDSGDPRVYDSSTYNDQDTSFISYEDSKRKPRLSASPDSYRRRERQSPRRYSPTYQPPSDLYSYFIEEESMGKVKIKKKQSPERKAYNTKNFIEEESVGRMKTKKTRSPEREVHHSKKYDNDKNINEKKRRKYDYYDEFEEEDVNYKQMKKSKKNKEHDSRAETRNTLRPTARENGYQVYAYQELDQHGLFTEKRGADRGITSPEIELKTHEYSVLDSSREKAPEKGSDTVYIPVIITNKKTKMSNTIDSRQSPKELGSQKQPGNVLVYAANLNNQKNIFQASTDGYHKKSYTEHNDRAQKVKTAEPEVISGLNYSVSLPYSLLLNEPFNTKTIKDNISDVTRTHIKPNNDAIMKDQGIINYQVNVDIGKENESIFGGRKSTVKSTKSPQNRKSSAVRKPTVTENPNLMAELEYKQMVEDPLHNDFPVTKDYIKVNDEISQDTHRSLTKNHKKAGGKAESMALAPADKVDRASIASRVSAKTDQQKNTVSMSQGRPDEEFTRASGNSKFSVLYGKPVKIADQGRNQTTLIEKQIEVHSPGESRLGSVATRNSQVNNPTNIHQGVIPKLYLTGERQTMENYSVISGAPNSEKTLSATTFKDRKSKQENKLGNVDDFSKKHPSTVGEHDNKSHSLVEGRMTTNDDKSFASGNKINPSIAQRFSTIGGRITTGDRKSLASGTRTNQSLPQQDNNHNSTIGGVRMATDDAKSIASEIKLNQSIVQQGDQRFSTIGGGIMTTNNAKSMASGSKLNQSIAQQNNERFSTIGGRMTTNDSKPMASETKLNQSIVQQDNQRFSTIGGRLTTNDFKSMASGTKLNQSIAQQDDQRYSTTGGRMTTNDTKSIASGTKLNQSTAQQDNQRFSTVGSRMTTNDFKSIASGTKLNQSIAQPDNQRFSTVGGRMTTNDLKSIASGTKLNPSTAQQDNQRFSTVGGRVSSANKDPGQVGEEGQQKETISALGGIPSGKHISYSADHSEQAPLNNEPRISSKKSMKSLTNKLVNVSMIQPRSRSQVSVSKEQPQNLSRLSLVQNKSKSRFSTASKSKSKSRMSKLFSKSNYNDSETNLEQSQSKPRFSRASRKESKSRLTKFDSSKDDLTSTKSKKSFFSILKKRKKIEKQQPENEELTPFFSPDKRVMPLEESQDESVLPLEESHDEKSIPQVQEINEKQEPQTLEQSCDCASRNVVRFRECVHFFLGKSLHEEIMNILKNI